MRPGLIERDVPEIPEAFHRYEVYESWRFYRKWNPAIGFTRRWAFRLLGLLGLFGAARGNNEIIRIVGALCAAVAALESGHVKGHFKGFRQGFVAGRIRQEMEQK